MTAHPSVAFVLSSISRHGGGIVASAMRLAQTLAPETQLEVFGLEDEGAREDAEQWQPIAPKIFPVLGPRAFGYAPRLSRALRETAAEVLHTHGLWTHPSRATARAGKPYLVTPHGMLDSWALQNSAWKKRVAAALFEKAHLRGAACIHALCEAEASSIRAYGLRNPICVIPNGVDLPARTENHDVPWAGKFGSGGKYALYLGRLHPKKNLTNLLRAWQKSAPAAWQLIVAGWDQGNYESSLKNLVRELGLETRVHFAGALFGEAKAAAYQKAAAFILPSLSEGLPMVVLEAWAHRAPVLMTPECNLPEGFAAGAAIRISTDSAGIARGLEELLAASEKERAEMGARGRELVQTQFSWPKIAGEMLAVYRWILRRGPKPESVFP